MSTQLIEEKITASEGCGWGAFKWILKCDIGYSTSKFFWFKKYVRTCCTPLPSQKTQILTFFPGLSKVQTQICRIIETVFYRVAFSISSENRRRRHTTNEIKLKMEKWSLDQISVDRKFSFSVYWKSFFRWSILKTFSQMTRLPFESLVTWSKVLFFIRWKDNNLLMNFDLLKNITFD
jgi:hypothetical protein